MRLPPARRALAFLAFGILSCADAPTAPVASEAPQLSVSAAVAVPSVVISQVYGGGGNTGATYRNDFIELFNPGSSAVSIDGWSVQYASAAGTTWQVTSLSGTIQPGRYYLVQQAAGLGGTTSLPSPEATGTIPMGGPSGKVLLVNHSTAIATACPVGADIIDRVGYGSNTNTTACGSVWGGRTATLSNTTAALRANDGCTYTGNAAADFTVSAPMPRNSATAVKSCVVVPPAPASDIVISEVMADPNRAAGGASFGEWFEVYNRGTGPVDLQGWKISSSGQPDHVIAGSVVVAPGDYVVLGRGADATRNGGVTIDYNYFTGTATTIWLDNTDVLSLSSAGAIQAEARWVAGATMTRGATRALRDVMVADANVDGAGWGYSTTPFGDGDFGTPGAANLALSSAKPAIPNSLSFSGRTPGDAALPVGFEDQIFASLRDGSGASISTTISWTSVTPEIASVDSRGVIRALDAGTATFRATAADGTTSTYSLQMAVPTASTTAQYANNVEFGTPADGDASDDFLIRRTQYTSSFNVAKRIPNWVSYNLDGSHVGSQDRCDCFTYDPELPQASRYTTADYTGAGTAAGYGIDRGHLARSFDRTTGTLDNANTFYFSNIIPQAADNNQGPWGVLETYLGDQARFQNREVYIIAGASGSKGTLKDEGLVTIPAQTWKVAVVMPRDRGLAHIQSYEDVVEVIAVIMPNDAGIRNVPWSTYATTVDAVEALSGYDVLSLLPDHIEAAIESNTKPPIGAIDGPYAAFEGTSVTMSGAASRDNGTIVSYEWSFGDGSTASGATVSHSYAQNGSYAVRLTLTDNDGLTAVMTTTAQVSNVAPAIAAFSGASLLAGEQYARSGSFTDPGADSWSATVDYGDGAGAQPLALSGSAFALSHTYTVPGTYTVTVRITDDETTSVGTATVVVASAAAGARSIAAMVDAYVAAGKLAAGQAQSFRAKALHAAESLDAGNVRAAEGQLEALVNEVNARERSGRMSAADAAALRAAAERVLAVI